MQVNPHALRVIRERSGLTVSELARLADVSQPHLSNIERGRRRASPATVRRLAAALKVPLPAILAGVGDHLADGEPEAPPALDPPARRPPPLATGSSAGPLLGATLRQRLHGPATAPDRQASPRDGRAPSHVREELPVQHTATAAPVHTTLGSPGEPPRRRLALGAIALGALVAGATEPASAETYYTGRCTVSHRDASNTVRYRTFQARINGVRGDGEWRWTSYDYRYQVDAGLEVGPHSDERVNVTSGYLGGLRNPWSSPDNHATTGEWVSEPGWKGVRSTIGGTVVEFRAAFDIPNTPDPHCTTSTATL